MHVAGGAGNRERLLNRRVARPVYTSKPERTARRAPHSGSDLPGTAGPALPAWREGRPGGTRPRLGDAAALLHPPAGGRGTGRLGRLATDMGAGAVGHRE